MAEHLYRDLSDWTRKAVDNYPDSDVSENFTQGAALSNCGDSLFSFVVNELQDAGDFDEAVSMLESAKLQLEDMIAALEAD